MRRCVCVSVPTLLSASVRCKSPVHDDHIWSRSTRLPSRKAGPATERFLVGSRLMGRSNVVPIKYSLDLPVFNLFSWVLSNRHHVLRALPRRKEFISGSGGFDILRPGLKSLGFFCFTFFLPCSNLTSNSTYVLPMSGSV